VRRALTTLWRADPSYGSGELPGELVTETLGRLGQRGRGLDGCVRESLAEEETRFCPLLDRGRRVLAAPRFRGPLSADDLRCLHETHGLPRDLVESLRGEGA
jgi:alanyl-tRNA synthetase